MTKLTTSKFATSRFVLSNVSAINVVAGLVVCVFAFVYLFPWVDDQFIQRFHHRYSDTILLGFIFFTIANKLIASKARFEPLFWSLIGAAFLSWLGLTIMRLTVWQQLNTDNQDLLADVSYFLFFALMITAIEVKSFSKSSRLLSQRSLISSLSVVTFLLGSFTYLILLPNNVDANTISPLRQSFYFYILMDAYLILRWWHLAWQAKHQNFVGYFFIGLASLNWLISDLLEYQILSEQSSLPNKWLDWLWYLPYALFFFGVRSIIEDSEKKIPSADYSPYHLLNSPLFFLGLISIWFLIESNINPIAKESSLQNVQAVWLLITLALVTFQIMELFEANKARILELTEAQFNNDSLATQLKQKTQLMESQSTTNQMILDTISNPIFTLDLNGKVLSSNLSTSKLLGYSDSELVDSSFSKLIPEEEEFHHFFDYQSYRQQLAKNPRGLEIESAVLTKSGDRISVHVTISQSSRTTRDTLVVSLADIRQQKKAEQQLHNLKDEFTANISHEFRTPLTIVNGVIEDLLSKPLENSAQEQLQTAKRNNLRLIHMVDQLLELSRVASDSLPITDIEASEWVNLICQSYNTIAKDREIDYGFAICESVLIRGNKQAFENILYNLLSNAFKYTQPGGSINVLLKEKVNQYQLIVADTGIGISKQEQSKIFDRFQRSEIDNQHSIPGAGIGLSLVKDLVSSMDWQINLESVPHKGSKFIVNIKKSL
jgi:PAS domain S-box-containing protein